MHQSIVTYCSLSSDQLIADLYWCVQSQNLLINEPPQFKGEIVGSLVDNKAHQAFNFWFESLKKNPGPLLSFFDSEEQLILGKYFERLLYFFFEHFSHYDLILSNHQLFEKGRTIGELDFIVRDKQKNEIIHLEAAVKYYMGYRNTSKHSMWIGPNGMDTLAKKMKKFEKQLLNSEREEIKQQVLVSKRKIILKGYFFKHVKATEFPYFYNSDIENCKWMYQEEMNKFIDSTEFYSIMPKNKWLGFHLDDSLEYYKGKQIITLVDKQIESIGKGIMLTKVETSEMKVMEKLIIAPNHWPRL